MFKKLAFSVILSLILAHNSFASQEACNQFLSGSSVALNGSTQNRVYAHEDVKELMSPYMMSGFQQDSVTIDRLEYSEAGHLTGYGRMLSYFISETDDQGFHLSVLNATALVTLLGIADAHIRNDVFEKKFEVYMRDLHIRFRLPIRDPNSIPVEMRLIEEKEQVYPDSPGLVKKTYVWKFKIAGGAFDGTIKGQFTFKK